MSKVTVTQFDGDRKAIIYCNFRIASSTAETFVINVANLVKNKNTVDSLFSLYFDDGRLYSTEGNLNWRLDIWQDVIFDLNDKDLLLTGYGYDSIIPAMERPDRQGFN